MGGKTLLSGRRLRARGSAAPPAPRGSERRACETKFPLSGAFFSILLFFVVVFAFLPFFSLYIGLNFAMLPLGISDAPFLTSLCFYPPPRAAVLTGVFLGPPAEHPGCSPAFGDPSCCWTQPQGEAEEAASAPLPQRWAGGRCHREVTVQRDGETQELGGQQEKHECVRVWGQREEWGPALSLPSHVLCPVDLPTRREGAELSLPGWVIGATGQERKDKLVLK